MLRWKGKADPVAASREASSGPPQEAAYRAVRTRTGPLNRPAGPYGPLQVGKRLLWLAANSSAPGRVHHNMACFGPAALNSDCLRRSLLRSRRRERRRGRSPPTSRRRRSLRSTTRRRRVSPADGSGGAGPVRRGSKPGWVVRSIRASQRRCRFPRGPSPEVRTGRQNHEATDSCVLRASDPGG